MLPVAVLVSGTGSNLQAILDASKADPDFGAEVVATISDRADVPALDKARAAGVPAAVVEWSGSISREAFTGSVCDAADGFGAEALIMAGFMRILSPEALKRFPDAILNIHPSLLPAFPGAQAVADALEHGVKVTGCTIHFADEEVDGGPIIAQEAVAVLSDDTEATLAARIHEVEHRLYPQVVKALAHGQLTVVGGKVTWKEARR